MSTDSVREVVIVVGNGVSGCLRGAARLASAGVPVTMIGPGLPHDRPPLSKRSLSTRKLPLLADEHGLVKRGTDHIDGSVTGVDLPARTVEDRLEVGQHVAAELSSSTMGASVGS